MTLKFRHLAWGLAWGGAASGLVWLGNLPGDLGYTLFGDALCGPWGWMPPFQALVALHGLWLLVLLPPAVWAASCSSPPRVLLFGSTLVAVVALGLVTLAAREAATWLPSVPAEQTRYLLHRVLYVVATLTDVPLTQLALVGTVCWVVGRLRGARRPVTSAGPEPARPEPTPLMGSLAMTSSPATVGIPLANDAPPPQRLPEPPRE